MEKPIPRLLVAAGLLDSYIEWTLSMDWLDGRVRYFVGDMEVTPEVYRDVLATMKAHSLDRIQLELDSIHHDIAEGRR
jgi:hypothetical protein